MSGSDKASAARLLNDPLLSRIFDKLEADTLKQVVAAPLGDDDTRRNLCGEVRAIQSVRRKLSQLASGAVTLPADPEA